ncbi:GIY-YIG catalytic domain-containing endonuclease [Dishui Lake large algae virus 1]|nr:GIY-YIG catalytic domain-containing endonuclease [Dishui Lake large algae virus 1]
MEDNKGQIYCIKNTINTLAYIGQTVKYRKSVKFGYEKRFKEHLAYSTTKKASIFGKAILEIGKDNFYIELLEECDINITDYRERYWIDAYNTLYPNGYNVLYGPPYSNDETVKKKISDTMKLFFANEDNRKLYSTFHMNKFKPIPDKEIKKIEIHPIKQDGENKIVYMYLHYSDNTIQRRRYGGIHEEYEITFNRCYGNALTLVTNDMNKIVIKTSRIDQCKNYLDVDNITKLSVHLHKMKENLLVAVYIKFTDTNERKRLVFGGKTIDLEKAYRSAIEFVNSIKNDSINIEIKETLVAARSSNCGKPLRDITTKLSAVML